MGLIKKRRMQAILCLALACCFNIVSAQNKPDLDRSGLPKKGKASYYGQQFYGRKMADGTPLNPDSNAAASRTLPLGTRARVTNLANGKSAEVEIRDRGPYVNGRIVDLSPKIADQLDFREQGLAWVEVHPIEIPPENSRAKRGAVVATTDGKP
jgi:rare lipoprotein A